MDNKALVSRFIREVWNEGVMATADEVIAPTAVNHNPFTHGEPPGPEGVKQGIQGLRTAFPDFQVEIEALIAEGDVVVARLSLSGTNMGAFRGRGATGNYAAWELIHVVRISNGLIVESWSAADNLGMFTQLGLLPDLG